MREEKREDKRDAKNIETGFQTYAYKKFMDVTRWRASVEPLLLYDHQYVRKIFFNGIISGY